MVELRADGSATLCQRGYLVADRSQRYIRYGYACPRLLVQRALDNMRAYRSRHQGPYTGHMYPIYADVTVRNADDYAAWDAWQRRER